LIRDCGDFGVIVIGDPRLKTKAYGRVFLEALPAEPVITESKVGAVFLAERLAKLRPAWRWRRGPLKPCVTGSRYGDRGRVRWLCSAAMVHLAVCEGGGRTRSRFSRWSRRCWGG